MRGAKAKALRRLARVAPVPSKQYGVVTRQCLKDVIITDKASGAKRADRIMVGMNQLVLQPGCHRSMVQRAKKTTQGPVVGALRALAAMEKKA